MAHYFESGFFVREKAWHGLGTVLQEAPTTREALHQAGLDWRVRLLPVFADADGLGRGTLPVEGSHAIVRDRVSADGVSLDALGVVGSRYCPLQNVDAFSWFDPLVADGDCSLEAAGSLQGGRKVWILARINAPAEQVGQRDDDLVSPFLLLSNSHDGTNAIRVQFTPIRVVCWNTLSAALADRQSAARSVRHTASLKTTLAEIRDTISLAKRDFSAQALVWREMGRVQINERDLSRFTRTVFGNQKDVAEALANGDALPAVRCEDDVASLFYRGPGAESAGRTAFGAYMAATHYIDHEQGRTADSRLASSWFAAGAVTRQRAFDKAVELAGVGR